MHSLYRAKSMKKWQVMPGHLHVPFPKLMIGFNKKVVTVEF
jgi:hypothetical protein